MPRVWRTANAIPVGKSCPFACPLHCQLSPNFTSMHCLQIIWNKPSNLRISTESNKQCSTLFHMQMFYNHKSIKSANRLDVTISHAFDSMCCNKLLCKLISFGIERQLLTWVNCYLVVWMHRTPNVSSTLSSCLPMRSGVVQGRCIGRCILYYHKRREQLFLVYCCTVLSRRPVSLTDFHCFFLSVWQYNCSAMF